MLLFPDKHVTDTQTYTVPTYLLASNELIGLYTGKLDEENRGLKSLSHQHTLECLLHLVTLYHCNIIAQSMMHMFVVRLV